jgi:cytochrome c biogenesis protein CcmG/thiol:disulfide interchange protein DsbE
VNLYPLGVRRYVLPTLVTLAAVALIVLLAFGISHQGENTSLDAQITRGKHPVAPGLDTALPKLGTAGTQTLASLRGHVVLLNVFASWCESCKGESAVLQQAERQLRARGGTVLGVTYLDIAADTQRFMRQQHLAFPVVRDISGNFVRSYGTDAVPETFVIDSTGHVAAIRRYTIDRQWLSQTLDPILNGRT